eukprot:m.56806 g.56806  ORF g.56806 m.56806 type:complete len:202 (+) comp13033_c1_seq2:247-852(+)
MINCGKVDAWRCRVTVVLAALFLMMTDIIQLQTNVLALSPTLPEEMKPHKFVFVIGAHHSGTTLLDLLISEHEDASALTGTHKPEDEGQHVQTVYKSAALLGGILSYAFNPESYMQEDHPLATDKNRLSLFRSWSQYWNMSKPYLVEKSPRHITMTRFLQVSAHALIGVVPFCLGKHMNTRQYRQLCTKNICISTYLHLYK